MKSGALACPLCGQYAPNAAPQASSVPGLERAHALSAEPAVAAPPQMLGLEKITQLPPPDEQRFHQAAPQLQTELGHFQELDSRYALGWNDAIEAAAVYCAHTLTENHPSISSYFRHAAINIRTLKLK